MYKCTEICYPTNLWFSILQGFLCSICGLFFKNKTSGSQHEGRHVLKGPFSCSYCKMVFFSNVNLQRHDNKHFKATKSYKCEKCGKEFSMKIDLNRHMNHGNKELRHKYNVCNKSFESPAVLKDHKKIHTKRKS